MKSSLKKLTAAFKRAAFPGEPLVIASSETLHDFLEVSTKRWWVKALLHVHIHSSMSGGHACVFDANFLLLTPHSPKHVFVDGPSTVGNWRKHGLRQWKHILQGEAAKLQICCWLWLETHVVYSFNDFHPLLASYSFYQVWFGLLQMGPSGRCSCQRDRGGRSTSVSINISHVGDRTEPISRASLFWPQVLNIRTRLR